MKALKTPDNFLLAEAFDIRFGKLDPYDIDSETGEPIEKWGMYDEEGNPILYAIDNNYSVVEFDPADKPEDYEEYKYFFIDGEFVLNPDWTPAPPSPEEQLSQLQEDIVIVAQSAEDSEEALCDLDETVAQRLADIEEALCELAELLS